MTSRHSIDWSILNEAADPSVAVLDLGESMMGSGTRRRNSRWKMGLPDEDLGTLDRQGVGGGA